MLEITENFVAVLQGDATLTATVPATSISAGPVDITMESQKSLLYPQINIWQVGESSRTVPFQTRDTQLQLDIWSRNSQFELETIYERILVLLNYLTYDQATAHIFWQRLGNATDLYEADRRVWHRAATFTVWSVKPST